MKNFNLFTGADIIKLEKVKRCTGDIEYFLYVAGIDGHATLKIKDFMSKNKFKKVYFEFTNRLIKIPIGSNSRDFWEYIVNDLLRHCIEIDMAKEDAEIFDKLKKLIETEIKNYDQDAENKHKINDFNNGKFILHNGNIIFKNLHTFFINKRIGGITRNELSVFLRKIKFKNRSNYKIGCSIGRAWVAKISDFEKGDDDDDSNILS